MFVARRRPLPAIVGRCDNVGRIAQRDGLNSRDDRRITKEREGVGFETAAFEIRSAADRLSSATAADRPFELLEILSMVSAFGHLISDFFEAIDLSDESKVKVFPYRECYAAVTLHQRDDSIRGLVVHKATGSFVVIEWPPGFASRRATDRPTVRTISAAEARQWCETNDAIIPPTLSERIRDKLLSKWEPSAHSKDSAPSTELPEVSSPTSIVGSIGPHSKRTQKKNGRPRLDTEVQDEKLLKAWEQRPQAMTMKEFAKQHGIDPPSDAKRITDRARNRRKRAATNPRSIRKRTL